MALQFIQDNKGNTTGVFIPIEEWQTLKNKFTDLQKQEAEDLLQLNNWQKTTLDERLNDYYIHSAEVADFDQTIDDIEKNL